MGSFPPRRDSQTEALTKYSGKKAASQEFKIRGIETCQRSTKPLVKEVQRDLIQALDEHGTFEVVCWRLSRHLREIRSKTIGVESLVFTARYSKPLGQYQQRNGIVTVLEWYRDHGIGRSPGQDVHYVVVDDSKTSKVRVRLPWEADDYDTEFYESVSTGVAESVVLPLGWDGQDIDEYLVDSADTDPSLYVGNASIDQRILMNEYQTNE